MIIIANCDGCIKSDVCSLKAEYENIRTSIDNNADFVEISVKCKKFAPAVGNPRQFDRPQAEEKA